MNSNKKEAVKITEEKSSSQPKQKGSKLQRNRRLFPKASVRTPGKDLDDKQLEQLCQSTFRYSYHQFKVNLENNTIKLESSDDESGDDEKDESIEIFQKN